MPRFGKHSTKQLLTIHPMLRSVLRAVIPHVDFAILIGRRGKRAQNLACAKGTSNKLWPFSAHNCPLKETDLPPRAWKEDKGGLSRAVDVAPWPIDWEDDRSICVLAGRIIQEGERQGVRIRWGGDWDMDGCCNWRDPDHSWHDLWHFELVED